jgi:photosystem II stability/assembly factor-like uncharacterized protein
MRRAVKAAGSAALVALAAAALAAAQDPQIVDPPAQQARLAARSLLLDVTRAGGRLVAVGERGHVLHSDDEGGTWTQAKTVPTSVMLTGVHFSDARIGWAVGHDEVILRTQDGGVTWKKVHYAPEAQQPLLDIWFDNGRRGIAIGAYGTYYTSEDGGLTWARRTFEPQPLQGKGAAADGALDESAMDEAIGSEFHLNQISAMGKRLYIAAEAGRLFRSDDGGATWITLPSPYDGSFFGVLPLAEDVVLAFGLRGRLYRSEDAGNTWKQIASSTVAMLADGTRRADPGNVVIVGLSGTVLVSRDGGNTFELMQQPDRRGAWAVIRARGGVVVAGEGGVRRVEIPQ